MNIENILGDKSLKAKNKVDKISEALLNNKIKLDDLLKVAAKVTGAQKGTCIEAVECITRSKPEVASQKCFDFMVNSLQDEAPRVKWESAKVIGNVSSLFKTKLSAAIRNLLVNTEDAGTVVRWSAAYALGEIILLKTKHNAELIPAIESIIKREENNAIRKIYLTSLKKLSKI